MGIDAKGIGTVVWKILGCSLDSMLKFTRKHPVFSSISVFLLALYIFIPSIFFFLIYSLPLLACIVVYALGKLNSRQLGRHITEEEQPSSGGENSGPEKGVVRSHLIHQRSVRRNARMKVDKWDSQTSDDDDRDKVILTSLYNDLLGRTPQFEESPKAVEIDVVDNEKEECDSSKSVGSSSLSFNNLGVLDVGKHILYGCETIEEEDKEVSGENKTEQKNSGNEPGISEIEGRRLESLIARRRERKLLKLASEQENIMREGEATSLIQNNLQISVPKNSGSLRRNHRDNASKDSIGSHVPGSAPSVLLPMRNPFDLPYDPQEERPILKGDSFDQEFSMLNQKDLFYSRHESFCRSTLFTPEPLHYIDTPDSVSSRKCLDSDRVGQERSKKGENAANATKMTEDKDGSVESGKSSNRARKVNEETDSDKESDNGLSSSGDSETEFSTLNKAELREAIRHSMGTLSGFVVNQARNNIPSPLPRGIPPRFDDNNLFYARRCSNSHTRTYSIASDLQVEFSEIGSPPTTVDWHDDSSNGGDSYIYDTDIDREIASGEEMLRRGSHLPESQLKSETKSNGEENRSELDREDPNDGNTKRVVDEVTYQKHSSSSDASEHVNSGRFEHTLFRSSASLSSIAEEPETKLESIDVGNHESMNEVFEADLQEMAQMRNEEEVGSTGKIDSIINDHADKMKIEELYLNFTEDGDEEQPNTYHGSNNIRSDRATKVVEECGSDKVNDALIISEINQNVGFSKKGNTRDAYNAMLDNAGENIEFEAMDRREQAVVIDREMKSVASSDGDAEGATELEETQKLISMSPYQQVVMDSSGESSSGALKPDPRDISASNIDKDVVGCSQTP